MYSKCRALNSVADFPTKHSNVNNNYGDSGSEGEFVIWIFHFSDASTCLFTSVYILLFFALENAWPTPAHFQMMLYSSRVGEPINQERKK